MALFLTGVSASQAACRNKDKQALHKRVGGGLSWGFLLFFFSFFPPQRCTCSVVANPVAEVVVSVSREPEDCSGKVVLC